MSYLSRRMREIKEEEKRRMNPWYDFINHEYVYPNHRVPAKVDPVNYRGRAG